MGTLIAMNNSGILVSNIVTDLELEKFSKSPNHMILVLEFFPIGQMRLEIIFLVNDSEVSQTKDLVKRAKDKAEDILKVNLVSQSINDMDTLGMIGVLQTKEDYTIQTYLHLREKMEEVFQIELMEGTVNFGLPLVGAGIVANSNGAVCGRQSTGVELGRMEEALKLF